jgi:hypothetical protein
MSSQDDDEPVRLLDSPTIQRWIEEAFGDDEEDA